MYVCTRYYAIATGSMYVHVTVIITIHKSTLDLVHYDNKNAFKITMHNSLFGINKKKKTMYINHREKDDILLLIYTDNMLLVFTNVHPYHHSPNRQSNIVKINVIRPDLYSTCVSTLL